MDVLNNLFSRNQRNDQSTPSAISTNSTGIRRYKWPRRRKHATGMASSLAKVDLVASGEPAEGLPGLLRVSSEGGCPVCACEDDEEYLYALSKCGHPACLTCWRTFVQSQVASFAMAHITCLACDRHLSRSLTLQLLKSSSSDITDDSDTPLHADSDAEQRIYLRYEDFLLRQCLSRNKHTRWCPRFCGYALFAHGFNACPRLECPNPECQGDAFCYRCRGPWRSSRDGVAAEDDVDYCHVCARPGAGALDGADPLLESGVNGTQPSLISYIRDLFRLPTTSNTGVDTAAAAVTAAAPGDGVGNAANVMSFSENFFRTPTTPTVPIGSSDFAAFKGSDNEEDGVFAFDPIKGDADISAVELDLPDSRSGQVKPCPRCKTYLLKLEDGSCNHMSCFICGCEFCWLCLREVKDTHYLSPTGCTFWGRRRWSVRLRLLVMLGAAVGAPFLLALLTLFGVPCILIGFPIYFMGAVASQVIGSKLKVGLLKTLAFFGGAFLSPLVTVLALAFVIPLVLIYVYIFMPISMTSQCRTSLRDRCRRRDEERKSSSSADAAVESDIGFKVNWNMVAASNARPGSPSLARSNSANSTSGNQLLQTISEEGGVDGRVVDGQKDP